MNLYDEEADNIAAKHGADIARVIIPVLSPVVAKMKTGEIREQVSWTFT